MQEIDIQKHDRLKLVQLLEEIRKFGQKFDESIQISYLNLSADRHASKRKLVIPLSEINDPEQLKYLKPKHKVLVPLLLKYFHELKSKKFKELIISALKVKGFIDATDTLVKEFKNTDFDDLYKWSIGDAFSIIQDGRYEDEYIEIIKNKKHGHARQMVTIALGKLRSKKAIPTLISLLDDEDVNLHVIAAIGYYKKPELKEYIEPFLNHKIAGIRKEAKLSIKKLNKVNKK